MKSNIYIDGLNVCMWKRGDISLLPLLCLISSLLSKNHSFHCFFDAVTFYRLISEPEKSAYTDLINNFGNYFSEITGGIEADEFILERANTTSASIISNDRYRKYWNKFEWLKNNDTERSQLIKGSIIINNLVIPQLGIDESIDNDLRYVTSIIKERLNLITNNHSEVVFPPPHKAKKVVPLSLIRTDFNKSYYTSTDSKPTVVRSKRTLVFNITGENDFKRKYFTDTTLDKNQLRGSKINEIEKEIVGKIIEVKFVDDAVFLRCLNRNLKIYLNKKIVLNDENIKLKLGRNRLQIEKINFEINIEKL